MAQDSEKGTFFWGQRSTGGVGRRHLISSVDFYLMNNRDINPNKLYRIISVGLRGCGSLKDERTPSVLGAGSSAESESGTGSDIESTSANEPPSPPNRPRSRLPLRFALEILPERQVAIRRQDDHNTSIYSVNMEDPPPHARPPAQHSVAARPFKEGPRKGVESFQRIDALYSENTFSLRLLWGYNTWNTFPFQHRYHELDVYCVTTSGATLTPFQSWLLIQLNPDRWN
ncbi:unnamed protein product [Nesidiocoris tenuis]|uniref:Uncharacterized protein n=1 Tax=Nesidiocoris tenuis TaxID=355587 RepID=A0A6H5HKB0_9HEMI|nr:unnamed protein product [Nesidiocoris tenuis]